MSKIYINGVFKKQILKSNNFYFTVIVLTSKNKTEGQNDEMDGQSRLLLIPYFAMQGESPND
jgi:hypothetical protein